MADEQAAVSVRYARLDQVRERAVHRLREALATRPTTPQSIGEREAAANFQTARLAALDAAESGLVFGRLDPRAAAAPRYVGRIGLPAGDGDEEPLLVDWRAPAAQPFYTATALNDLGIARRRHIRTRLRTVVGVSDEVLDPDDPAAASSSGLTGEAALLAALNASRTGRMTDIVRTIQAEQDRIIRADARGVLVVQGGPGTGKTAVALHRAAYLLYTHRERLAKSGLLIVGPSRTFLRYIADVLPSLGETGVLLADLGSLRPGLTATGTEAPEVAAVKGRLAMVDVLKAAVRDRQALPDGVETVVVDRTKVEFRPADAKAARTRGRAGRRLHNEGRRVFAREVVDIIARRYAEQLGADPLGGTLFSRRDLEEIREEVAAEPSVRDLIDRLWPRLTPERLLTELYASPARIRAATRGWSAAERALLHRPAGAPWTPADVPLLEEAEELLGADPAAQAAADRRRRLALRHAQETLDVLAGSRSTDADEDEEAEFLSAGDVLTAELLAERQAVADTRTVTERAAADRTWTFGHVVVDEAQELSAMAWRVVLRRCPTRSMTVVGDVAQTGSAAGATSWEETLRPHLGDGWRMEELTVNYRTPAEIMAVAADVLAAGGAGTPAPRSVRSTGVMPRAERVEEAELPARAAAAAARLAAEDGTLAVLAPPSRLAAVAAAVAARLPGTSIDAQADLTAGPVVLPPEGAKGLEFDAVLVVDPRGILAEGVRGWSDLYVALTRATRALAVVHPGELPPALSKLAPRG